MKNWYIVQSHSSFENKVAGLIKEEAEKAKIADKFDEIVVPTHDVTEVKRGKRIQRKKKYFPGYVLIKSEMDNNIYHMIKNIKRVSGFLGSKGMPVPVSDKEIEKILGQIKTIAVGDNYNDLDMLKNSDIPCLVFNDQFKLDQININNLIFSNKPSPEGWADVIKTALVKLEY